MSERIPFIFTPGIGQEYYISRRRPPWDTHWNKPDISASHNRVMNVIYQAGFETHFNQPNWKEPDPRRWFSNLANYAKDIVANKESKVVYIGGFSVGGLIALKAAEELEESSEVEVKGVLGASVSSYCGEEWFRRTSHEQYGGTQALPISQQRVLSELKIPAVRRTRVQLYVGTEELDTMRAFHEALLGKMPQAESIRPPCAHNILDESYVQAIEKNVGRLLTK